MPQTHAVWLLSLSTPLSTIKGSTFIRLSVKTPCFALDVVADCLVMIPAAAMWLTQPGIHIGSYCSAIAAQAAENYI